MLASANNERVVAAQPLPPESVIFGQTPIMRDIQHKLEHHEEHPAGLPGAGEDLHPVDHEADPQHRPEGPQQDVDDLPNDLHGGEL